MFNYITANTNNSMGNNSMINIELYNQVIKGYLICHRHKEAIEVFDKMMQIDGQHPNVKTYTIMMDYYRQTNNVNGAIEMLREMEERGFYPNIYTYENCIYAAAYGDEEDGAFEKMFSLFDEMIVNKEIMPHRAKTFCGLITGCGKIGDIESATKVLHLMDKMGIKRNGEIYHCYLRAIGDTLQKRRKDLIKGERIDIGSTRGLKQDDLVRLGESIVAKMMEDNDDDNDDDSYDEDSGFIISLKDSVDINVINALLSIYCSCHSKSNGKINLIVNRAILFFQTMIYRFPNVEANKYTYLLIFNMCIDKKRYNEAKYIFDLYKKQGYKINITMYRKMLELASKSSQADDVAMYLNEMEDRGLTIRERDKAHLAVVIGTKAEQYEARKRQLNDKKQLWKDDIIRNKATKGRFGLKKKGQLKMKKWDKQRKYWAEREAGLRLYDDSRTVGKIYWNVDKTLGQIDDPW